MMHGFDVEGISNVVQAFDHVVVGKIAAIRPHPNADKLRIAEVVINTDRSSSARQEIVCGAPNIEVGQKVPVALLGASLPNGLTIEKRSIRGVESNGMLCAMDELGLGKDHSGIMVLDQDLKVGTPFAEVMKLDDPVIDVTLPANRADLMSIRGVVREIGAMLEQMPEWPAVPTLEQGTEQSSVTLESTDTKLCSIFTACVIRGVALKPTPPEIVNRLRAAGMRLINCIVDITNYVMLEYGQPLHAYDAAKVKGAKLAVRVAHNGEVLQTLDGKSRKLSSDMLVIVDAERIVGLAGVMGGEDTEVSNTTTDIILEAAIFNPVSIRKTSRQLGLVSEASKRFEKGLWLSLPEQASLAAATMIAEVCGGTIEPGFAEAGNAKVKTTVIDFAPAYIEERLGMKVSLAQAQKILEALGFTAEEKKDAWQVTVPEWRLDVSLPEDLVDEVGRMIGYDELGKTALKDVSEKNDIPAAIRFKEEVKNILVDLGLTEIISHAFYSKTWSVIAKGDPYEVANPLDKTQQYLRTSLQPQMIEVLKCEADAGKDAAVFEIGRVFERGSEDDVPPQPWKLAIGLIQKPDASKNPLEGLVKKVLEMLEAELSVNIEQMKNLVRGRQGYYVEIAIKDLIAASKKKFGDWDPDQHITRNVRYQEQSKYPAITRDIAFWWSGEVQTIEHTFQQLEMPLVRSYALKDTFAKHGKISYAYSFIYQAPDRTLTKDEVDVAMKNLIEALTKLGASIR